VVRADVEEVEDVLSGFFEVDIAPNEPDHLLIVPHSLPDPIAA
jgi:hypothetical protein